MRIWIVAGEYPTPSHPGHGTFVADQVAALHAAGHDVEVIESLPPSLRPLAGRARLLLNRVGGQGREGGTDEAAPADPSPVRDEATPDRVAASVPSRAGSVARWGVRAGIDAARVAHDGVGTSVAVARMLARMAALAASSGEPDVVHAHNVFPAGIAAERFAGGRGIPYVVTEHMTAYLRGQYAPVELAAAMSVLERAAAVVAVSRVQAEALPIATDRVTIIPNVVDVDRFRLRGAQARRSGSVLAIGRLTPHKRMDVLIRAYAGLPAELRAAHPLRIVGDGPERGALATLVGRLGLDDGGVLVGRLGREDVAAEMAGAAVLVSASAVETFGVTLIEALAAGVPFVATDSGGPRDIVGPGLGVLVERDEVVDPGTAAWAGSGSAAGSGEVSRLTAAIAGTLRAPGDDRSDEARRAAAVSRFGPHAVAESLGRLYAAVR